MVASSGGNAPTDISNPYNLPADLKVFEKACDRWYLQHYTKVVIDPKHKYVSLVRELSNTDRWLFALSLIGPVFVGFLVLLLLVPIASTTLLTVGAVLLVVIGFALSWLIAAMTRSYRVVLTRDSSDKILEVKELDRVSIMASILGSLVALVLLIVYAGSVYFLANRLTACIYQAQLDASRTCEYLTDGKLNFPLASITYVQATVYGLLSAIVVSTLAATEPGKAPTGLFSGTQLTGTPEKITQIVSAIYIITWIMCGLAALFVGVFLNPQVDQEYLNQTLAFLGLTWLGTAVIASYAYFGITPEKPGQRGQLPIKPPEGWTPITASTTEK